MTCVFREGSQEAESAADGGEWKSARDRHDDDKPPSDRRSAPKASSRGSDEKRRDRDEKRQQRREERERRDERYDDGDERPPRRGAARQDSDNGRDNPWAAVGQSGRGASKSAYTVRNCARVSLVCLFICPATTGI